jgi:hypothetical protein
METPITPEPLIELGFRPIDSIGFRLDLEFIQIETDVSGVSICIVGIWHETNASTIEDVKDLIRLFK